MDYARFRYFTIWICKGVKKKPALLFGMQVSDYLKSGVSVSVYAFHFS